MKTFRFWLVVPALLVGLAVGVASAKLPPMSDADKAKAAEKKAKADVAKKKAAEALAKAQERAAQNYNRNKGTKTAASSAPKKKR